MSDIDEAIHTYLLAIEIEGKSPRTIASYANSLQDFRRVGRRLGHPASPREYTVAHVYEFLGALRERGAAPGYQHRRHREVKTCFSWLKRMDMVDENVFARVPLVRRPMVIRPPFSPEQITALLQTLDRSRLTGCRNEAQHPALGILHGIDSHSSNAWASSVLPISIPQRRFSTGPRSARWR